MLDDLDDWGTKTINVESRGGQPKTWGERKTCLGNAEGTRIFPPRKKLVEKKGPLRGINNLGDISNVHGKGKKSRLHHNQKHFCHECNAHIGRKRSSQEESIVPLRAIQKDIESTVPAPFNSLDDANAMDKGGDIPLERGDRMIFVGKKNTIASGRMERVCKNKKDGPRQLWSGRGKRSKRHAGIKEVKKKNETKKV